MLVTYFVSFRWLNDHLFGKELFNRFTASAFRKLLSVNVFSCFPFGFEGRMWDLIVSVPDHYLSFYFSNHFSIWTRSCENMFYAIYEQQKCRSACVSAQSDQHLCCSLLDNMICIFAISKVSRV